MLHPGRACQTGFGIPFVLEVHGSTASDYRLGLKSPGMHGNHRRLLQKHHDVSGTKVRQQ